MADGFFTRPIFSVSDVAASIAYYCERLGFTKIWEHGGDKLIIAQVERDGIAVILDTASVLPRPSARSVITVSLDQRRELGALHRELAGRGARITAAPFQVIWQGGTYQFDVEDLDGNVLVFWGDKPE